MLSAVAVATELSAAALAAAGRNGAVDAATASDC